jgi:class 3 adenylate cyclase
MDTINIVKEEKILTLSRANRSLHEFLLPDERDREEKPILNHVIVKADIRGSMDITSLMRARGLNPASYFSLNFFDPISEILSDYDGSKVFIEGDAIILSIFEHEDTPQGWYGVARACGLAIRMLDIVRQYNVKNQKHDLPILELGIGICYNQSPPTFLFDGDSRIMISPAINQADRLSSCNKMLRKRFKDQAQMFNLLVYQNAPEEEIEATADDLSLRYNVSGIELNPDGFAKLSREINLESMMYPVENNVEVKLYTGKVPTVSGKYQRLVIREATILEVKPETMDVIGKTSRKYYEVCTHPDIYEFIKNRV